MILSYFNTPRPVVRAFEIAFWILFGIVCGLRWASASDETHATMLRVEQALVAAGYAAHGYSDLPAPAVELVDELPGDRWGTYSVATGRITLSRRQPDGCRPLTLAHEIAHDAVARLKLHLSVPVSGVIAFMERVSLIAEAAADADQFAPNCTRTRGSL